jgi:hypothetical protein
LGCRTFQNGWNVLANSKNLTSFRRPAKHFAKLDAIAPSGSALKDATKFDNLTNDGGMKEAYWDRATALAFLVSAYEDALRDQVKYPEADYPMLGVRATKETEALNRLLNHYHVTSRSLAEFNEKEAVSFKIDWGHPKGENFRRMAGR